MIIVRGAGDLSTGTIHRLFRAGFRVLALETERPAAIRRQVAFSEAVYDGTATVENVTAVRVAVLTTYKGSHCWWILPGTASGS